MSADEWLCACGEMTRASHWRHGADGAMFHAGADAPSSDPSLSANFDNADDGRTAPEAPA